MDDINLSIIIPSHNCASTIERCLNSIVDQADGHLQVICVDDGSTDNTAQIIKSKFADIHDFVTLLRIENSGPGVARNEGLKLARGKWVFFLDSDDQVSHDFLNSFNKTAATNPDVDMILLAFATFNERCNCIFPAGWASRYTSIFKDDNKTPFNLNTAPDLFFDVIQSIPWNKIVIRELLEKNNICFSNLYLSEDMMYSLPSAILSEKIVRTKEICVIHSEYSGASLMDKKNEHALDFVIALKELFIFLKSNNLIDKLSVAFSKWTSQCCKYNMTTHFDGDALQEQATAVLGEIAPILRDLNLIDENDDFLKLVTNNEVTVEKIIAWANEISQANVEQKRCEKQIKIAPLMRNKLTFKITQNLLRFLRK